MKMLPALVALALPAAVAAAPAPRNVTVEMTNDGFVPRLIYLRPGRLYAMRFTNPSDRTHDFSPGPFFAASRVTRGGYAIRGNKVELAPGEAATIRLTAPNRPGARFAFRSTKIEDAASGLKGYIYIR